MFEETILLNEFNRGYLSRLLADLSHEDLDWQPHSGLHSVRWILTHLAICVDYGFAQLGMPFVCSPTWHAAYGSSSQAGSSADVRPELSELTSIIDREYARLCDAARIASADVVNVPHEIGLLKSTNLKSRGDLICHLLATHFAAHLGQLSTLRRLLGKPMLF